MKNRFIVFVIVFIFSMVGFVSIGYSAFNTSLSISGDAIVRSVADIRIDGVELISKENGAVERYNNSFSKSMTSMSISLPNVNSSITYCINISNSTGKYFTINSINEVIYSNKNIKYTISGLDVNGVYQGNSYSFNITFTTSLANQSGDLTLKYDFASVDETVWDFPYVGSEKTFNSNYNATYKLEVWGAQGGYAYQPKYHGGYGAYSKGEIELSKNNQLYINVGGSGGSASAIRQVVPGGYNGGGANTADNESHNFIAGAGGGATHIAKVSGLLSSIGYNNRSNIVIVAGGGGGATYNYTCTEASWQSAYYGGSGGGAIGLVAHIENTDPSPLSSGGNCGSGGTQTTGGGKGNYGLDGSFGAGASGTSYPNGAQTCGGGGGFFGGGSSWGTGGGGGSGYIANSYLTNKEMYCYGCANVTDNDTKTFGVNTFSATPTARVAKEGSGYARITLLPKN